MAVDLLVSSLEDLLSSLSGVVVLDVRLSYVSISLLENVVLPLRLGNRCVSHMIIRNSSRLTFCLGHILLIRSLLKVDVGR